MGRIFCTKFLSPFLALRTLLLLPIYAFCVLAECPTTSAQETTTSFGRFGTVTTYQKTDHPKHLVLFISGDGGWNLGVIDMARSLATLDTLVVGINITHYLQQLRASKEACVYPASDFEELSKYIQKKFSFAQYVKPIIVGYSSGATLAYAAIAQAPANTFAGAISLGFCSDMEVVNPFCTGAGLKETALPKHDGWDFLPDPKLRTPWTVLHGSADEVCSPASAQKFLVGVPGAKLVTLPKVGHGFSVQKNWMPQFVEAFKNMTTSAVLPKPKAAEVSDLPIVEVFPAGEAAGTTPKDIFAIVVSGDGGWASIDKEVAEEFSKRGVPVAGLNTLEYFWRPKSKDQISADLERMIRFYSRLFHKPHVLLVGYSFGAEVLPFMTYGLPNDVTPMITKVALLSASKTAEFQFHFADWISESGGKDALPIAPEVNAQSSLSFLCVAGSDESDSLCRTSGLKNTKVMLLPGGHHLGGKYSALADTILN